ncbi:IS481 family transposase, partial [Glutamicibacter uratoxydans]
MTIRNKQIITAVVHGSMNTRSAAAHFNVSERWVKELIRRYAFEGETAYEARSKRPKTSPGRTPEATRERIVTLREILVAQGLDAGAETIQTHLETEGISPPSRATIHRILRQADLVSDQPQKRPKSSLIRFEAAQPNEMWQADFTHWRLADGSDTEILDFIDDYSRFLISIRAYRRVTGRNVAEQFAMACDEHGRPQSSLTDNGLVFTTRFTGKTQGDTAAKNQFEKLLQKWDVKQINGSPNHPQTQGKIERFHRTLKLWLTAQPRATSVATLNKQLSEFQQIYNERRPHKAAGRKPPSIRYRAVPKAVPKPLPQEEVRQRNDVVDKDGKLTIRYGGKLRHLGMGRTYSGIRVEMYVNDREVTVVNKKTGEILRYFKIDPSKNYQKAISS